MTNLPAKTVGFEVTMPAVANLRAEYLQRMLKAPGLILSVRHIMVPLFIHQSLYDNSGHLLKKTRFFILGA